MNILFAKLVYIYNQIANNFYPLEVVGRGSETQLQVGKHYIIHCITCRIHLYHVNYLNFQPLEVVSRYRDPQLLSG